MGSVEANQELWIKEQDSAIHKFYDSFYNQPVLNNLNDKFIKFGYNLSCVIHSISISISEGKLSDPIGKDLDICTENCESVDCVGMSSLDYNGFNKCMDKSNYYNEYIYIYIYI